MVGSIVAVEGARGLCGRLVPRERCVQGRFQIGEGSLFGNFGLWGGGIRYEAVGRGWVVKG